MRALGIDLGARRIGVAVSDAAGTLATPIEVVQRSGDRPRDHRRLLELAVEWEAELLVVGLPLSLDGTVGPAAEGVIGEVAALRDLSPLPVDTYDERLTTVTAERQLAETSLDGPGRRKVVDMVAAAVLLQAFLDGNRPQGDGPPEPH